MRPFGLDDGEAGCQAIVLFFVGFVVTEQLPERDIFGPALRVWVADEVTILVGDDVGGVFDGRADEVPPRFEAGLRRRYGFKREPWITKQDGKEGAQDFAAVGVGPIYWISVVKGAIFRIEPIDVEPAFEGARSEVAAGADVIAGEDHNCGSRDGAVFGQPENAIRVVSAVSAFSIEGQLIAVPRAMLSHAISGRAVARKANKALRRSSSEFDQATAGARWPTTAVAIIWSTVVLPPPRRAAVTKKPGRSASTSLSMIVSAKAINTHLPE